MSAQEPDHKPISDSHMAPPSHPRSTSKRSEGQATRGKTAHNRLRRVDDFLLAYDPGLLSRSDGPYERAFFVDLGYGEEPITTLESANRLRQFNPDIKVLGVEIDPVRVADAQPYADEGTFFRLGGFNLPLKTWPDGTPETIRLVRAFNVLRQYKEGAVSEAYDRLLPQILPGGLLIEGTSDPFGSIWVANLVRRPTHAKERWQMEGVVFSTNFRSGFDPTRFQTVLPKSYIHRVVAGEPIHDFFQAWRRATLETSAMQSWGPRSWFVASAQKLAEYGYSLKLRRKWLRRGWLIWDGPSTRGNG